jgi:hypothetical protein
VNDGCRSSATTSSDECSNDKAEQQNSSVAKQQVVKDDAYYQRQRHFVDSVSEETRKNNSFLMTNEQLQRLCKDVEVAGSTDKRTTKQYRLLRRYELVAVGDRKRLIARRKNGCNDDRFVVSLEEAFDVLSKVHVDTMHARINATCSIIKKQYYNITQRAVEFFLSLCETCAAKKRPPVLGVVVKPIRRHDFGSRGQLDLMDYQSHSYNGFRWVLPGPLLEVRRAAASKDKTRRGSCASVCDSGPTDPTSLACMVRQQHDDGRVTLGCRVADCQENFSETAIRYVLSPSCLLRVCPTKTYSVFAMLLWNSVNSTGKATLAAVAKPVVDRASVVRNANAARRISFAIPAAIQEYGVIISTSLTEMNYSVQLD